MDPNNIYLIPFTYIDDDTIYVYSQNRLAHLDKTSMIVSMDSGITYDIDISVVPTGDAIINSAIITKNLGKRKHRRGAKIKLERQRWKAGQTIP